VLSEQHDAVDQVVPRELVDLQLRQQQVRDRNRRRIQLKPPLERDGVSHLKLVKEDIRLQVTARLLVHEALDPELLGLLDRRVQHVAALLEHRRDRPSLL
jgi:hypothetical protein